MSWNDVGKEQKRGAGRFVQFEDGQAVTMRILDSEPFTIKVHKVSQVVRKGDKSEEVFRTIQATANPDDNYILKNTNRYPEQQQYNLRVWEYKKDASGKATPDGELKILQGGNAIFKSLKTLYEQFGNVNEFDIIITRTGKGRETEYTVSASPFAQKVNLDDLRAKLAADETLRWDNVFAPITGEEQAKILKDAGMDVNYDPAGKLMKEFNVEQAHATKFTFGKYGKKGEEKTVGEVMVIDAGYVEWAAQNVTTNDALAAACRVAVAAAAGQLASEEPRKQVSAPVATPTPSAQGGKKDELARRVATAFDRPEWEDMTKVIEAVKKHGGGKTKVKDLTIPQLESLLAELEPSA